MRHGRAVMPWGKYKGVRLRLIPNDYLSWLSTIIIPSGKWKWLYDSLISELKFRGFAYEYASTTDPIPVVDARPKRKIRKE